MMVYEVGDFLFLFYIVFVVVAVVLVICWRMISFALICTPTLPGWSSLLERLHPVSCGFLVLFLLALLHHCAKRVN